MTFERPPNTPGDRHAVASHFFIGLLGEPTGLITEGPDKLIYGASQRVSWASCDPARYPDWSDFPDGGVYKFNPETREFKQLVRFNWLTTGGFSWGPLVVSADLSVYGTMVDAAGTGPVYGAIFKVREGETEGLGTLEYLHTFTGGPDGAYPASGLIRGFDGALYGTTMAGGFSCDTAPDVTGGTIFRITEGGEFITKYSFDPCATGTVYRPFSPLLGDGAGRFLGATYFDWLYQVGTDAIFEFDVTNGALAVVKQLDYDVDGVRPYGLAVGASNYLYGAMFEGGSTGAGTVFGVPIDPPLANWAPFAMARQTFPTPITPTIEATGPKGAVVHLTGEGSYDEDFDPIEYQWTDLPVVDELGRPARPSEKTASVMRSFPVGVSTVSLAVRDAYHNFPPAGTPNPSRMDVRIEVVDATPPSFASFPSDRTVLTTSNAAVVTYVLPTATDIADPAPVVACFPASGTAFPVGATQVDCTATDFSHNTTTQSFIITVLKVDIVPPVVTTNPAGFIEVAATSPEGAQATFIASAVDDISGALATTCAWSTGSVVFPSTGATPTTQLFPIGATNITCSATDSAHNTGSVVLTVYVLNGVPMTLGRFVVFSLSESWLFARTQVLSGDVGANDRQDRERPGAAEVRLGQAVRMLEPGSRVIGDTVWLQPHSSVNNVITNHLVKQQGATIQDSVMNELSLPFASFPVLPASTPGIVNIVVGNNKTVTLEPGQYGNVTVRPSGTLVLTGGVYQLQNLDLGSRSSLRAMAPVRVHVRGELSADARVRVNDPVAAPALPASQIVFWVAGEDSQCRHRETHPRREDAVDDDDEAVPAAVHIGTHSTISANIAAPRGTLRIQGDSIATGAFIGARVRIGAGSQLTLDSAFD